MIDYDHDVPQALLIPEHHWPAFDTQGLSGEQRVRFNHLACLFTCEMFVHFEEYIVRYVERHKTRLARHIAPHKLDTFVREEREHIDAFYRLLQLIAPERYAQKSLKMLAWSRADTFLVWSASLPAFFVTASLFEEMTLYVADVMEEKPEESFDPVHAVMRLHAKEERSHVGIDNVLLRETAKERPRALFAAQLFMSLPIIVFCDQTLARGWKKQVKMFGAGEGLTAGQVRGLERRGISLSDRMGLQSFFKKQRKLDLPGGALLCGLLERFTQ